MTTSVTNLDIHDLARSARTFGVSGYFVVTPIAQQRSLVARIVEHWRQGQGRAANPIRAQAFELVRVAPDVESVEAAIERDHGARPTLVATGAGFASSGDASSYGALRERLRTQGGVALLLFGTGWGMANELVERCDMRLPGIRAAESRPGWNHLSVRSAVAIILDRLLGDR